MRNLRYCMRLWVSYGVPVQVSRVLDTRPSMGSCFAYSVFWSKLRLCFRNRMRLTIVGRHIYICLWMPEYESPEIWQPRKHSPAFVFRTLPRNHVSPLEVSATTPNSCISLYWIQAQAQLSSPTDLSTPIGFEHVNSNKNLLQKRMIFVVIAVSKVFWKCGKKSSGLVTSWESQRRESSLNIFVRWIEVAFPVNGAGHLAGKIDAWLPGGSGRHFSLILSNGMLVGVLCSMNILACRSLISV